MKQLFQSREFYAFLEETGFLEPFRFSVTRDGREVGVIQGFIQKDGGPLKRFFSRRAIVNGGPYLSEDIRNEELEDLLRKCQLGLKRKAIFIEIRNFADYSRYRPVFEKMGFSYQSHYDFHLDTSCLERVDARMGKSRKRDVQASLNHGVTLADCDTDQEVTAFYSILERLYREKVKTPLFPIAFFLRLRQTSFCKFILVKYQDEIVGGTVCVYDEETVYEWFVCGMDGVYRHIFPSTVATFYGIRFAVENGFKCFDMMGAGSPGDAGYGVRDFKAKFGGDLVEYGRFRYVYSPVLYQIGTWAVKLMKHKK